MPTPRSNPKGFKGATLDYRKIQDREFDPLFLRYMQQPEFAEICRRTYGDVPVAAFRAMFMNKPAQKGTFLPWHQDRWAFLDRDPLIYGVDRGGPGGHRQRVRARHSGQPHPWPHQSRPRVWFPHRVASSPVLPRE